MFRFKQFTINDDRSAMKVGTDGVLLGSWADVDGDSSILDVGTGTGIIAIMAAQRSAEAQIVALDINGDAVAEARDNADASPWGRRIVTQCVDVAEYEATGKFDHIISNPPFFTESLQSPDRARSAARHASSLPFETLVSVAESLLCENGKLSVILPVESGAMFRSVAFERLWLSRLTEVVSCQGDDPKRVMMEFRRSARPIMPRCDRMPIHDVGGAYSQQYRELTSEFYLKF
jgi:tRNA1Val (adenine37-N6)-methyltransferase